ncbi:MAG TPA: ATP-binding protein [Acidimicrobiales bacterium]|nr:ATP-binding protein [Acidimicrobiales bacterium]
MSASSAQFQFAAEFVLFLAAASGLAVVALRSALLSRETIGTTALAIGFASFAASAFLHGSALVDDGGAPLVVGLRAAGVAAMVVGVVRGWAAGRLASGLLVASAALVGAATVVDADTSGTAARVLLTAGGIALGGSVLAASRRSIAARFAATAATTLLIVVLVLGVAVSAVLVNTVEDSAVQRLEGRAATEATAARFSHLEYLKYAKIVAVAVTVDPARVLAAARATEASDLMSRNLADLSERFFSEVSFVYVGPTGAVQGVFGNISSPEKALELAGSSVVAEVIQKGGERGSVDLIGDQAVTVGAYHVELDPGDEQLEGIEGVVVALRALDDNYLALRAQDDGDLSLAMFANSGPVATHGVQPPGPGTSAMVRAALVDGRASSGLVEDRFVAVTPVLANDGTPALALVASTPTTLVNRTRDELFRNLFLVALGGAMLALLFASLVGARIGAGLSRLRTAAEAIEGGNFDVRSGVRSDDEVGVLSRAFDSMAESVQDKTAAEIRLRGRLEAVVAGMGEALVAVDGDGLVTDFNRAAEQLIGVHHSDAIGRPFAEIIRLVGDDGTAFAATATPPGRSSTLGWVTRNGGRPVPVAVSVGVLHGPGSDSGGRVLVLADLTREREVEQMKTQFLTRVGHELRHPLVPMMGYAEILTRREVPSDQAREMHQEMLAQSKVLLRIVEMLEFFAAAGAGRVSLRREALDPKPLVEEVVRRWQARAPGHTIRRVRTRRPVPPVFADRRRLVKCLDELLDNAVKFSPAGGVVSVTVEAVEGGVEIGVLDHGIGMTEDEQEKVFSEFVKADPSDTTPYAGLGLGLAFVRRVVEAHGGALTCRSAVGKGSKLSIFLPDVPREEAG